MLQYLSHFPVAFASSALTITVLCDSQSVIDCITIWQQTKYLSPGKTIQDDYNVYNEITHTTQCLQPINL